MLNKPLYSALCRVFGKDNVTVVKEDLPMAHHYDEIFTDNGKKYVLKRDAPGQEFHLRCPICRDYKKRLSISHLWGLYDEVSNSRNLWLIQCWNENCYSNYEARKELYTKLYDPAFANYVDNAPEYDATDKIVKRGKPKMPGKLWRIDRLAEKSPNHQAVLYANRRLLDIKMLGLRFGVGFCPDPTFKAAANRLIAPVVFNGNFKGWTGRYIDEHRPKAIPKWFHDPNMLKSKLLYNYDRAKNYSTKVLVEGPGDVWGVGPQGMGLLGKTISPEQLKLITACCDSNSTIVVLLDPAQDKVSKEKNKPHHIANAVKLLRQCRELEAKILPVYMSIALDPLDCDRSYLFKLINSVAKQQKIRVELTSKFSDLFQIS
jgi:hypothetical protein